MDFALTEEQEFFKKMITDTVDRMVVPKAREIDEKDEFPWELWREFGTLGYLGLRYPEEIGGMNADPVTAMIFYEQIARGSVGFAQSVIMNILMGTYFIYRFGSDEIKKRCLYPAMKGEKVGTMCFTEDQSGSDLSATRTTARKDGNEWVINGTKMWITNGPIADMATVLATTDLVARRQGPQFFPRREGDARLFRRAGARQAGLQGDHHGGAGLRQREGARGEPPGKGAEQGGRVPGRDTGRGAGDDGRHGPGDRPGGLRRRARICEKTRRLRETHRHATSSSGRSLPIWPPRWRRAGS